MSADSLRGVITPASLGVMTPDEAEKGICAACGKEVWVHQSGRAAHHNDQPGRACMGVGHPVKPKYYNAGVEKGDIFQTPEGAVARVFRASKYGRWVDIVVVDEDFSTWSKRMPLGIPITWKRLPRQ